MTRWGFRKEVEREWREYAGSVGSAERDRLLKRLEAFMRCGSRVNVRACGACGSVRSGSGTFEGTKTCKVKACPFCSWVRAKRVGEFFEQAFDLLDTPGYRWQQVTVTMPYDPAEDATVADLRSRAIQAINVGRFLWKVELKQEGAAAYRHVEVSARGHVHLNIIYFGPPLAIVALEHQVQTSAHADVTGAIHTQPIDYAWRGKKRGEMGRGHREYTDDPRGSKEGLKAAARYAAKGMDFGAGTGDEDFLADQAMVRTVDPVLAARWDIATLGLRLSQKMGAVYGLKLTETADVEPHVDLDDSEVSCGCCGVVGDWLTRSVRTDRYMLECHRLGGRALVAGTWRGPPPDS